MMIQRGSSERRAFVLLSVVLVVVILSLAAYQFSDLMSAESDANASAMRATQTRAWAESGVHFVAGLALDPLLLDQNGGPYDNQTLFRSVPVGQPDQYGRQGYFTVIALNDPLDDRTAGTPYRFGLEDESGKINLNALIAHEKALSRLFPGMATEVLMKFPEMTEEVADATLDWLDEDEEVRTVGAEIESYPNYVVKNGSLNTLDELLLVKGFLPELLRGGDRNLNGSIDGAEQATGELIRGWAPYLTVHSREPKFASDGIAKIDLNREDVATLQQELLAILPPEVVTFILAMRIYGPVSSGVNSDDEVEWSLEDAEETITETAQQAEESPGSIKLKKLSSVYDLVDRWVERDGGRGQKDQVLTSPLQSDDVEGLRETLPLLLDYCTTFSTEKDPPARVNVNTASPAVIASLPGLTEEDVQLILDTRPEGGFWGDPVFATTTWLLTEAEFPATNLARLEKLITARPSAYRFQVIGHFDRPGPTTRLEAVVDVSQQTPRIAYIRDLTELGTGFDLWNQ